MTLQAQTEIAERELLGSMMVAHDYIDEVVAVVQDSDFYTDAHQKIFAAVTEIHRAGVKPYASTVGEKLLATGKLADVRVEYLGELIDGAGVGMNVIYMANQVRHYSILRQIDRVSSEFKQRASSPCEDASEVLAECERDLAAIANGASSSKVYSALEMVNDAFDRIDARANGRFEEIGVPSGYMDIDKYLSTFRPGELCIIGARPSVGKTALAINIALNIVKTIGTPVLFFSLEQSRQELMDRILSMESGIPSQQLRKQATSSIYDAGNRIRSYPLYVDDQAGQTMLRIGATARRMQRRHKIGAIFIDYLQLIHPEDRRVQRYEQIGQISRRLKLLARDLNVPVICPSQLNRASEDRGGAKPRLSDLRESGSIEQDADVVLLLHRDGVNNLIEVNIAKHRNGPTGEATLYFRKEFTRFESHAFESEMPV